MQLSGTVEGRQLAVSDGAPDLQVGDCDPNDGVDTDVCAISKAIDGTLVVLVFENPAVLEPGASIDVADPGCGALACDDVVDVAVVDVQVGVGDRLRATGGRVRVTAVEPFQRYAGSVTLDLPDGRLSGMFDLVPLPDDR